MERNPRGRPRHPDVLTPAEWRVLEELREGGTNAEIAARLGISGDAVKYHISNMLGKLELRGRDELAAWRPERRRGRLGAVFAVPAAFEPLVRSLAGSGPGLPLPLASLRRWSPEWVWCSSSSSQSAEMATCRRLSTYRLPNVGSVPRRSAL